MASPAFPTWFSEQSVAEPTLRITRSINADPLQALSWDDFKGQAKAKSELILHINSSRTRDIPLSNTLLSAPSGLGKTTLAHIVANEMNVRITCISPQDHEFEVFRSILRASDKDIIFFDEVHALVRRKNVLEGLLPILAQWRTLSGDPVPRCTFIAATTDADRLPEAFLTRFLLQPFFEPYTIAEMREIIISMAKRMDVSLEIRDVHYLAKACGGVPRTAGKLVLNARVLADGGIAPTAQSILNLSGMTNDGLTRLHVEYLRSVYKNPRTVRGYSTYRMGFTNICTVLHQPKETVERLERILIDKGYITLQPGGRELTEKGVREVA